MPSISALAELGRQWNKPGESQINLKPNHQVHMYIHTFTLPKLIDPFILPSTGSGKGQSRDVHGGKAARVRPQKRQERSAEFAVLRHFLASTRILEVL